MREIVATPKFDKDIKLLIKRGYDIQKLLSIADRIAKIGSPALQHRPHKLVGNWVNHWECHIRPDWLLIYMITDNEVRLVRTGTHADLF